MNFDNVHDEYQFGIQYTECCDQLYGEINESQILNLMKSQYSI